MSQQSLQRAGAVWQKRGAMTAAEKGIRVLIDGEDASDATWGKLFEIHEDGSFYMGDYILEDLPQEESEEEEEEGVQEEAEDYMKSRRLKEIHFDIVYHR
mgnify:CR=1 FL=1